ncbi:NAD+ synthase (glutamine-hydrolysing) [Micractinium conductrix]|nr:NAD+ synthase (glutamine-hydrolysing) [Micractinium conductrix]|eukprot:PSC71552.1 NAD+ synthase (glutamine-hydrolysing) [Micractinium conductrix]
MSALQRRPCTTGARPAPPRSSGPPVIPLARSLSSRAGVGAYGDSHRRGFRCVLARNELNKWADRSNYDEHDPDDWERSQFDSETLALVLKVMTAKATQRLLLQLQELDLFKAQWLTNYCSENPPSGSNKFLVGLFKQPSTVVHDASTATDHTIDPANLAHRIIQIRGDMASSLTKFPKFVELENASVMREHLASTTYVSGSPGADSGSTRRRGYYNGRRR